jgi:hypothetical protein
MSIQDRFTRLPISRQRKYQLRHNAARLCTQCADPAAPGSTRCLKHLVQSRELQRANLARVRRNTRSLSYLLEKLA